MDRTAIFLRTEVDWRFLRYQYTWDEIIVWAVLVTGRSETNPLETCCKIRRKNEKSTFIIIRFAIFQSKYL